MCTCMYVCTMYVCTVEKILWSEENVEKERKKQSEAKVSGCLKFILNCGI